MHFSVKRCYTYAHFQKPTVADCGDYFIFQHYSGQWLIIKGTIAAEKFIAADVKEAVSFAIEQAHLRGRVVWLKLSETKPWKAVDSINHLLDVS